MGSPAKLAAIPLSLVHNAILVLSTGVGQFLSYCPLEKSLQTTEKDTAAPTDMRKYTQL
jgi:hypothetical protein